MYETTYIRDPQTFRQTAQQYKKEDNLNQTQVNQKTLNNKHNIKCPLKNNSNNYNCQICNRLRQICPYNTNSKKTVYKPQKINNFKSSNIRFQNKPIHNVKHILTPTRRVKVIQQIVYYPQIHNILVHQPNPQNTVLNNSLNTTSPKYNYRHRSTTANINDKFSSPIRVNQYDSQILSPQQIKNLTQSMIN